MFWPMYLPFIKPVWSMSIIASRHSFMRSVCRHKTPLLFCDAHFIHFIWIFIAGNDKIYYLDPEYFMEFGMEAVLFRVFIISRELTLPIAHWMSFGDKQLHQHIKHHEVFYMVPNVNETDRNCADECWSIHENLHNYTGTLSLTMTVGGNEGHWAA